MKHYLSVALALACTVLVISLIVIKRGENVQHESYADTLASCSNRLMLAQAQIVGGYEMMLVLSNRLAGYQSASSTLSNLLTQAQSAIVFGTERVTNLTRQVAEAELENQALRRQAMDLTNQITGLASQIALTETNLARANKDYALLENRLRRDVAERVVVERKFYSLSELQGQMERLKTYPGGEVSAESIYAGLDVEVKSNAVHVISPE